MLPNWGFRNVVHATVQEDNALEIKLRESGEKVNLTTFVTENVPQVKDKATYWLRPLLFNGTLQTLYTFKADMRNKFKTYFAREIITISEEYSAKSKAEYTNLAPGEFTVDYVVTPLEGEECPEVFNANYQKTLLPGYPRLHPRCRYYTKEELENVYSEWKADNKPITIIVPGLAGGIQEAPIRATCDILQKKGHHVLVYNTRGCSRSKLTTPNLFSGLMTDDLKYVIHHLRSKYGSESERNIHVIGFSFGGTILANYLAFEGENSQVTSACSVSSPWDLVSSNKHINDSLSGHYLFQPAVVHFLLTFVKNNMAALDGKSDNVFSWEKYNVLKKTIKTSEDFDDAFTSKAAGFPSGRAYYYAASPSLRILKIKTPMLILNTKDDPMISTDYPFKEVTKNPYLYMATTDLGGHYSSIDWNGNFWYTEVIENWTRAWDQVDTAKRVNDHGFRATQTKYQDRVQLF